MDCVALPCRLVGEQALFLVCSSVYWWGEIQLSRLGILFCSSALSCIVGSTLAAATQLTHRKGCSVSPVQKFVHGLLPGHIPVSGGVYTSVILYVLIISMDVVPLTRSYTASDGHVPLKFFLIFLGVRSLPHTPPPQRRLRAPPALSRPSIFRMPLRRCGKSSCTLGSNLSSQTDAPLRPCQTHAVIKSVRKATQQPSEERAELEKPETVEAPELAGHNDIYVGGALEGVSSVSSLPGGVGKSDDQDDSGGKSQGGKGAGGNRRRRISDNGSMSDSARSDIAIITRPPTPVAIFSLPGKGPFSQPNPLCLVLPGTRLTIDGSTNSPAMTSLCLALDPLKLPSKRRHLRSNVSGAEGGEAGARSMPRWVEPTSSFEAATSCSSVSSKSSIASSVHRPISPERVNQARVMVRIGESFRCRLLRELGGRAPVV